MSVTRREVLAGGLGVLGGLVLPRGCGEPKREGPRLGLFADAHIRDAATADKVWALRDALADECDHVFGLGDVVDGESPEEWGHVRLAGESHICGNHDYWQSREPWKRLGMPNRFYAKEVGGIRVLVMDTGRGDGSGKSPHSVDPEQMEWLQDEVKKGAFIALSHVPLVTIYDRGFREEVSVSRLACLNGRQVARMFRDSGNCRMVISGHTHLRETVHTLGIRQETLGAVSGYWWDKKPVTPGTWPEDVRADMIASPRAYVLTLGDLQIHPFAG